MDDTNPTAHQPPARMVAGALAHLARHMETGCPRSAYLAAMLLEQVANDPDADEHLRAHARELVEILERDRERENPGDSVPAPNAALSTITDTTRRETWTRTRY